MEDSTGKRRWVNIGHKVDGMTVEGYNSQSNTLILANGTKKQSLGLQGGTVFDSTVPDKNTMVGSGTISPSDQSLADQLGMEKAQQDEQFAAAREMALNQSDYDVDPAWVEQTKKNFMQGEYFKNNPQIKGVHTLEEYKALEATGGLKDGVHMIMKNEQDGVGLDYFYHGKDAGTPAEPPVQVPAPSFGSDVLTGAKNTYKALGIGAREMANSSVAEGAKQTVGAMSAGAKAFAQDPSAGLTAIGAAPLSGVAGLYNLITKSEKK